MMRHDASPDFADVGRFFGLVKQGLGCLALSQSDGVKLISFWFKAAAAVGRGAVAGFWF